MNFERFIPNRHNLATPPPKTLEQIENERISRLVAQNCSHQPTLSYLAKCYKTRLPLLCDKCLSPKKPEDLDLIIELDDDKKQSGTARSAVDRPQNVVNEVLNSDLQQQLNSNTDQIGTPHLEKVGVCEFDDKFCLLYKTKRPNLPVDENHSKHRNLISAPASQFIATHRSHSLTRASSTKHSPKSQFNSRSSFSFKNSNSFEPKHSHKDHFVSKSMNFDFDSKQKQTSGRRNKHKNAEQEQLAHLLGHNIEYEYTKKGLEIKRLSSKNWLVVDVFTPEICKDHTEKSYLNWLSRKREIDNQMKQIYPSKIYEEQLESYAEKIEKGPLPYIVWAKQSYKIALLKEKIRKAKDIEQTEHKKKLEIYKSEEARNGFNLWKLNKKFSQYR